MKLSIVTLFPDFFAGTLSSSMLGRAQSNGTVEFEVINLRDYTSDSRRTTDDRPFGGGPGMVLMIEPIFKALSDLLMMPADVHRKHNAALIQSESGETPSSIVILTSAKGARFTQKTARALSSLDHLILLCGHYEGVDERVAEHLVDQELRIGDYVLTGGEPAALVISDAVTRLLPGVLGNEQSNQDESHSIPGQLGYPQYTRPKSFHGWDVPEVLIDGHHQKIQKWRTTQRVLEPAPAES